MQSLINVENIHLGECSECLFVVIALVVVMFILVIACFKYAIYKDKQILKSKKKGKK